MSNAPEYAIGAWLLGDVEPSIVSDWSNDLAFVRSRKSLDEITYRRIKHVIMVRRAEIYEE